VNRKNTHNSSVKSNVLEYRESEVDDDLAYKYYKKKMGVMDIDELDNSDDESSQKYVQNNQKDEYSDDEFDQQVDFISYDLK
jgi:hypothetical protein